jgi:hypothetical protein
MTGTSIRETIVNALSNSKSAQFAYLRYRNEAGELSTYKLLLNTSFMNLYKQDLETIKNMNFTSEIELKVQSELIASIEKSINTEFQHEKNPTKNMTTIHKSIKFHDEKDEMYLHCLSLDKKVIEQGVYKTVNSSEKTIIKNKIKKNLKQSKIRFFKLNLSQIEKVSVNNTRLLIVAN